MPAKNAGKYRHKIDIFRVTPGKDGSGFKQRTRTKILTAHAQIKTTSGYTLIQNNSDFEKALTNFTIRWPGTIKIERTCEIDYAGKTYTIEYLNNINESNEELEMQAKEVTK